MLPPISSQGMSVLDYLAYATEPGEDILARDAMAYILIPGRSARRVSLRLSEYGLLVRGTREETVEKMHRCELTGDTWAQTDTKTCVTMRITPLGRRLVESYYRCTAPPEE